MLRRSQMLLFALGLVAMAAVLSVTARAEPKPLLSLSRLSVAARGQYENLVGASIPSGTESLRQGYTFGLAGAYCLYDPGQVPHFGNAALIASCDRVLDKDERWRVRGGLSLVIFAGK